MGATPMRSAPANDPGATDERTIRLRALNDLFRQTLGGGYAFLPEVLAVQGEDYVDHLLELVGALDSFDDAADPAGVHDFGLFEDEDEPFAWAIDCYAPDLKGESSDPADPRVTIRVLTIIRAERF